MQKVERKSKFILQEYECAHSATRIIFYNKAWHGTRPSRMPFCRNFVRMPTQHLEFDLDFCLFWIRSLVHLVLFIQTLYMPFAFTFCWNLCRSAVRSEFVFSDGWRYFCLCTHVWQLVGLKYIRLYCNFPVNRLTFPLPCPIMYVYFWLGRWGIFGIQ